MKRLIALILALLMVCSPLSAAAEAPAEETAAVTAESVPAGETIPETEPTAAEAADTLTTPVTEPAEQADIPEEAAPSEPAAGAAAEIPAESGTEPEASAEQAEIPEESVPAETAALPEEEPAAPEYPWDGMEDTAFSEYILAPENAGAVRAILADAGSEICLALTARIAAISDEALKLAVEQYLLTLTSPEPFAEEPEDQPVEQPAADTSEAPSDEPEMQDTDTEATAVQEQEDCDAGVENTTIPPYGTSGTWHNIQWSITRSGALTVSGSGDMPTESGTDVIPWARYHGYITSVTIASGITSISYRAFLGCMITGITIPNTVTRIDAEAFRECTNLTEVTIPDSVTSGLGDNYYLGAFYKCTKLRKVTIGRNVPSISYATFYGCSALTEVNIPESVTVIETYAFYGCSSLVRIQLPSGLTKIGDGAFSDTGLQQISIPSSITTIGNHAFSWCSSLTSVVIPTSVTIIFPNFYGCVALTDVYYGGSQSQWQAIKGHEYLESIRSSVNPDGSYHNPTIHYADSRLEEFVRRLYSICLNRNPSDAELAYYVGQLTNKTATGTSVAYNFILSSEFSSKNLCCTHYVTTLYRVFFNRTPADSEPSYWVDRLYKGTENRGTVFRGFGMSNEFNTLCSSYGILRGTLGPVLYNEPAGQCTVSGCQESAKAFIKRLYTAALDRDPTSAELNRYAAGLTNKSIKGITLAYDLVYSNEFQQKNYCYLHYISMLYGLCCGRTPSEAELDFWLEWLCTGEYNRTQAFLLIATGGEFNTICGRYQIERGDMTSAPTMYPSGACTVRKCPEETLDLFVKRLYNICLKRQPAKDEILYYRNLLAKGAPATSIAFNFFGSPEYRNHRYDLTQYVSDLYRVLLDRTCSDAEKTYHCSAISNGLFRADVYNNFSQSAEFLKICKTYGVYRGDVVAYETHYRALLIGNLYACDGEDQRPGNLHDAETMTNMLDTMTATPYQCTYLPSRTAGEMVGDIASVFADAGENDVSLFFFSGHGASNGSLCGEDYSHLTLVQLKNALDRIPGKKIVLLDSCYSGQAIARSVDSSMEIWAEEVISVFSGGTAKTGELAFPEYYVMTAAAQDEWSWFQKYNFGWFTLCLEEVCGFNEFENCSLDTVSADTDGNGLLTLHEVHTATYNLVLTLPFSFDTSPEVVYYMHPRVYPENCSFVLFGRR